MIRSGRSKFGFLILAMGVLLASGQNIAYGQGASPTPPGTASDSGISMSLYPVMRGTDGQQYMVTRAGYQIAIPGLGLAPDANQIAVYRDQANNYWYINRNNQAVKVTHEQLEKAFSQVQLQAQAVRERMMNGQMPMANGTMNPGMMNNPGMNPMAARMPMNLPMNPMNPGIGMQSGMEMQQGMPMQQQPPVQVTQTVQQAPPQQQSSSGSGSSALVSGLAAAGGAMAGAAMTNAMYGSSYYGMPYGTAVWHDGDRAYYNGADGKRVYVAGDGHNSYVNQWNRQQTWDNMSPNQKAATENVAKSNANQRQQRRQVRSASGSRFRR